MGECVCVEVLRERELICVCVRERKEGEEDKEGGRGGLTIYHLHYCSSCYVSREEKAKERRK